MSVPSSSRLSAAPRAVITQMLPGRARHMVAAFVLHFFSLNDAAEAATSSSSSAAEAPPSGRAGQPLFCDGCI